MVERAPQIKQDEQHPLLKVDSGGGDSGKHQTTPALIAPGWGVKYSSKQSWLVRWPEYISACWMTCILIGISFLVFYGLGIEAYRRQSIQLIKCNGSKPSSDVFYHQIVTRGSCIPIILYTDYLSNMAYKYPLLTFHIYFLVDDSIQRSYRVPRHSRYLNTLIPMPLPDTYPLHTLDDNNKRELEKIERKLPNINVTIMALSKYMGLTPLKYKWRNIPLQYLPFYARVFSVWQNGGVGMDLSNFNNNFNSHFDVDRRISAILKQHNDGIKVEEYTNILNKLDREEETAFFSVFCGLMQSILNDTRMFLTKNFQALPLPQPIPEKNLTNKNDPTVRILRNKREVSTEALKFDNSNTTHLHPIFLDILNTSYINDLNKNEYRTSNALNFNINRTKFAQENTSNNFENIVELAIFNKTERRSETLNVSDNPQLVFFYDFSVLSDSVVPYSTFESSVRTDVRQVERKNKTLKYGTADSSLLSLDSEGTFIAASARLHPFLGQLISAGCQRLHPKFAIQDTVLTQCSGIFNEDVYCNNIYLL